VTNTLDTVGPIRPDYPEPLWIQAVNLITSEIESGVLKPGMRLPPERELCTQLTISRVTLRKALNKLVEDGLLNASHGRGWYVAPAAGSGKEWPNSLESFSETAARMGLTASSTVLTATVSPANLDEADELSIAPGTPLFYLERVRLLNAVPIALERTHISAVLLPDHADIDFSRESLYAKLTEAGLEFNRADSTIEAREADPYIARNLDIAEGKPLLVMHQLVYDRSEKPMFSSTIQYSGDRYRLRTFFSRAPRH
jgi:GntR family transcriptional regulator